MKFFLIIFTVITSIAYGQSDSTSVKSSSIIKVYTPSSSVSNNENAYKWVVKTDLFSYVAGEFPIIAEYRLTQKFSTEVSLAMTYDFFGGEDIFSEETEFSYYETDPSTGSAFRAAIKYYPSHDYDAIEGWSFGVQLFTKTYNSTYSSSNNYSWADYSSERQTKRKTGVALIISRQMFWDSNICYEFTFGIGFASVNREYLAETYNNDISQYTLNKLKTSEKRPDFQLGLRIGFGN